MGKIRQNVLKMTSIALCDGFGEGESSKTKQYLINLITDEGLDAALLVLWYVYANNLRSNHIKSVLLNVLSELENENIHRFAMAMVGEQFIRKDVEMINRALDYIERHPSRDVLTLLHDVNVDDIETMSRAEAIKNKILETHQND